jgi:hypothetical protein
MPKPETTANTHFVLREDGVDIVFMGDENKDLKINCNQESVAELRDVLNEILKTTPDLPR